MTDEQFPTEPEQPLDEPVLPTDAVADNPADEPKLDTPSEDVTPDVGLTGSIEALEPLDAHTGDEAEPDATTIMLATGELTDAEAAALAAAALPAAGSTSVLPAAELATDGSGGAVDLAPPEGIDMGPDGPSRWWVWVLIGILVLAVLGGVGYAYWWSTSRPIRVPDIVGKQAGEATQILNDVALRLGDVSEVPTDAAPPGVLISQNPEAGTELKPTGRVSFVVASNPTMTEVPETNGKLSEEAEVALAKARLRPVIVESFATTVAAGYVVSQLPSAGVALPPGAPVALVVSKGPIPATVSVPRVVGLPEADAGRLLEASNLQPLIYRSYDASIAAGTAILQAPTQGLAAPYNSPVQVLISQGTGTATIVVPTVSSQTRASAIKELKGKGLKAESRTVSHPTIPKGQVISQMPPAGRKAVSGTTVGLLVSRGNVADATVPSLVGTASAGVADAVTKAGFVPVLINVPASQAATGTVFMQYPLGGSPLTRGLPVVCLISSAMP